MWNKTQTRAHPFSYHHLFTILLGIPNTSAHTAATAHEVYPASDARKSPVDRRIPYLGAAIFLRHPKVALIIIAVDQRQSQWLLRRLSATTTTKNRTQSANLDLEQATTRRPVVEIQPGSYDCHHCYCCRCIRAAPPLF